MPGRIARNPAPPVNPALANVISQLKTPVNASRVIDARQFARFYGKPDGAAIELDKIKTTPYTGIDKVDKTTEKVTSLSQFGQSAVKDTISSTVRGTISGAACGFLVGLLTQGKNFYKVFTLKLPLQHAFLIALLTGGCAGLGGTIGLYQSWRHNLKGFKELLRGGKSKAEPAPKALKA